MDRIKNNFSNFNEYRDLKKNKNISLKVRKLYEKYNFN